MALILKVKSFLVIMICLAVCASGAGKSKLKEKVKALDRLFHSKMYLVDERLDIGEKEREKLFKKYEEAMVNLETKGTPKSKSRSEQEHEDFDVLQNEIEKLSNKVETNTKDTDELSDTLIRLKRGALSEKVARKSDLNIVIKQFKEVQKRTRKVQEGLVTDIKDIKETQNEIGSTLNTIVSNQNNIFSKLDEILTIQGDLISIVGNTTDQYSAEKLEKKLDTHEDLLNSLRRHSLPIMLVGGSSPKEGRVEINHAGRHGTVCNDEWDDLDAKVVCTMLGYGNGIAVRQHKFGPGIGEILLDDVECNGNEKSLLDCIHPGIGVNDCRHIEDAAVRCEELDSNDILRDDEDYNSYYAGYDIAFPGKTVTF